jgi:AcrR family transcriptional regulator
MTESAASPRPGRPPRQAKEFLDAALDAFASRPASEVTMDDVAALAGATKPTLYKNFSSKETLLAAILDREGKRLNAHLGKVADETRDQGISVLVPETMRAFAKYAGEHRATFKLLFGPTADVTTAHARSALIDSVTGQVTKTVREYGKSQGIDMGMSAVYMARILVAIAVSTAQHALLDVGADPEEPMELAIQFSLAAIRNLDLEVIAKIDSD